MGRLVTGIGPLDAILGGGFLPGSLVVLAGPPGSGKTILAQQICFANATTERQAIYYTTQSEPHAKLIRHLDTFDFFDRNALGSSLAFYHLGSGVGDDEGIKGASAEIIRKSFDVGPAVVVVDSAKALHHPDDATFRPVLYELASLVSHTDTVLVFVGEYLHDEIGTLAEFAVADAILYLHNRAEGALDQRGLHVVKLRGSPYLSGVHTFTIDTAGINVFPRLEAMPPLPSDGGKPGARISTGVAKLDNMMNRGLPIGSATLVGGPSGVGKTCLALHFAVDGLQRGERSLYISFQESVGQLQVKARGFGWDIGRYGESFAIQYIPPVEASLDVIGAQVRDSVARMKPARVVLDSISEIEHAASRSGRYADFLPALVATLRSAGATSLLTNETPAFFGPAFELASGLSYVFDNVLLLRYTELQSEIRRALAVVKMRESEHVKSLVEFDIGSKGMVIKGEFAGLMGVLTGTPIPTSERFRDYFGR